MTAAVRARINQANAAHSTGPKTPEGKQRASMNAFQHGLTGNRMMLQPHEQEAYTHLTQSLIAELNPATESERQLVQRIIDCNTRLNRIATLETNILNFGLLENMFEAPPQSTDSEPGAPTEFDDRLESMAAQTRSWLANENSFEKLGRYEARLSRQLLAWRKELERLQAARRQTEIEASRDPRRQPAQLADPAALNPKSAWFRETPSERTSEPATLTEIHPLSGFVPNPEPLPQPQAA
jgi:hypothetical protein